MRNTSLFGVQYYGGTHLGPKRFQLYRQVASTALQKLLPNQCTDETTEQLEDTVQDNNKQADLSLGSFTRKPFRPHRNHLVVRGGKYPNSSERTHDRRVADLATPLFSDVVRTTPTFDFGDFSEVANQKAEGYDFAFAKPLNPLSANDSWAAGDWVSTGSLWGDNQVDVTQQSQASPAKSC